MARTHMQGRGMTWALEGRTVCGQMYSLRRPQDGATIDNANPTCQTCAGSDAKARQDARRHNLETATHYDGGFVSERLGYVRDFHCDAGRWDRAKRYAAPMTTIEADVTCWGCQQWLAERAARQVARQGK